MTNRDDDFPRYWTEEKDWLVELVMLPKDADEEELEPIFEFIGKLLGFSMVTDTRILAQVGDPDIPGYELWFSFLGPDEKLRFLELVKEDGFATPEDEGEFDPPQALQLDDLRPLGSVFSDEQYGKIMAYASVTADALDPEPGQID